MTVVKMEPYLLKQKYLERFLAAIKLYAFACRWFGVMPIKLYSPLPPDTPISNQSKKKCFNCKIHIRSYLNLFQLSFALFAVSAVTIATHSQYTENDTNLSFLTRVLYMGEYVTGILNMFLITTGAHYKNRRYLEFAMELIEIDVKLQKCGTKIDYNFLKIYLRFYLILYAVFFSITSYIDFSYNNGSALGFFRSSSIFTIPNIICMLGLTQYSSFMYCIRIKFIQLNRILRKIARDSLKPMVNYVDGQSKLNNIISVMEFARVKETNKMGYKEIFNVLRIAHADLCKLNRKLNDTFGILLVSVFITTFSSLLIQFYAVYKEAEGFTHNLYLTIYSVFWIVMMTGKSFIVLFASSGVDEHRTETSKILYEIEENNLYPEDVRQIIYKFSMQMLHQRQYESACGIIDLNLMQLHNMVGALSTYLVILIQFDANSRSPASKVGYVEGSTESTTSIDKNSDKITPAPRQINSFHTQLRVI